MRNGFKVICAAAIAIVVGIGPVIAQGKFDHAIKARKSLMSLYAWNLGQLAGMAKGDVEYNADAAKAAAENLRVLASMNHGSIWPQGSDSTANPGATRAKLEAWTTYPESAKIVKSLIDATTTMAGVADTGVDSVRANMAAIGAACTACHTSFREEQ